MDETVQLLFSTRMVLTLNHARDVLWRLVINVDGKLTFLALHSFKMNFFFLLQILILTWPKDAIGKKKKKYNMTLISGLEIFCYVSV